MTARRYRDEEESHAVRYAVVAICCLLLGAAGAFLWRERQVAPPPECPPAVACPVCPGPSTGGPGTLTATARRPLTGPRPLKGPPPGAPLPALGVDPEDHRERLRRWFEGESPRLNRCVAEHDPRRKVLLQMKIEPDGKIADARVVGGEDLPAETTRCVRDEVRALRVPADDLRGRETLVVHVTL